MHLLSCQNNIFNIISSVSVDTSSAWVFMPDDLPDATPEISLSGIELKSFHLLGECVNQKEK